MFPVATVGSCCAFPRRPYTAADLPAEYHPAVLARFERAAFRDLMREAMTPDKGKERIRTEAQREGIRERAQEAASEAYARWLSLRGVEWCAAGEHERAVNGTVAYMRRSGWRGVKGLRRERVRQLTEGHAEWMDRRREAMQDRPETVAMARERIGQSPALARKAYRLAERSGIPGGVPAMLTLATLAGCSERGRHVPQPTPECGVPAVDGDGTEWRGGGALYNGAIRLRDDERQKVG